MHGAHAYYYSAHTVSQLHILTLTVSTLLYTQEETLDHMFEEYAIILIYTYINWIYTPYY